MYEDARVQFYKISSCVHNNPIDYYPVMQAYGYALLGDRVNAQKLLQESIGQKESIMVSHYRLSQAYVALGNHSKALDQLEQSYENRDLHLFWIKVDPGFDPIRNEPRFRDVMTKMNLAL